MFGFIFGDGIYEVVPAYGGRPFRFAEHMARLDRSLAELRIATIAFMTPRLSLRPWNGWRVHHLAEAKVSVLDRGFVFGDGVSEVVPVYNGRPFRFAEHKPPPEMPPPPTNWCISRSPAAWPMRDHVMPTDITPTVFAMASVMKPPSAKDRTQGVACVTADDFRWQKAHIKRPACWAPCLRARSAPTPAPPKP